MIPKEYQEMVENFLNNFSGDKTLARQAFEELFSLLVSLQERGEEAERKRGAMEAVWAQSEVQQLICWTPLRQFLKEFTHSSSLWIRSAAKGEIVDQTGEFWGDPEIALVSRANLHTMFEPRGGRVYYGTQRLAEVLDSSIKAGLPIPGVRVVEL